MKLSTKTTSSEHSYLNLHEIQKHKIFLEHFRRFSGIKYRCSLPCTKYSWNIQINLSVGTNIAQIFVIKAAHKLEDLVPWLRRLTFRRSLFVGEEALLTELQSFLSQVVLNNLGMDQLRWRWDENSGCFSVKLCYEMLENSLNNSNPIGPMCNLIWSNACPPKIEIFLWQALQGKIATADELIRRTSWLSGDYRVWVCVPYATRLKNQLNISCSIAMFHGEFGLILCSGGACPPSIYGHLSWWMSHIYKEVENRCWHSCFFAVIWSIWLSRNEIIFNKVLDKQLWRI